MIKPALFYVVLVLVCTPYGTSYASDSGPTSQPTAKAVELQATPENQETQSWWQHIVITIITTTGAIAVPVLSTLMIILLRRWNIKVEYEKAEWVATQAKNYAEQLARNALKEGKQVEGSSTARLALDYSRQLARDKLAPWSAAQLAGLIEAKLGEDNKAKPKPGEGSGTKDAAQGT